MAAGKFHDLQKHATKIIKFKQSSVARSEEAFFANMQSSLDNGQFNFGFGSCLGVAVLFLKDFLEYSSNLIDLGATDWSRFERGHGSSSNSDRNRKIFANAISMQNDYLAAKGGGKDQITAMVKAVNSVGLKQSPATAPRRGNGSFDSETIALMAAIDNSKAILMGYYFTKPTGTGGHAIAIGKYMSDIYFFDPNIGGYTMPEGNFKDFITEYRSLLKSKGSWDVSGNFDFILVQK
jgi:hypothetical protein